MANPTLLSIEYNTKAVSILVEDIDGFANTIDGGVNPSPISMANTLGIKFNLEI